jgi:hypothetical protein
MKDPGLKSILVYYSEKYNSKLIFSKWKGWDKLLHLTILNLFSSI